MRVGYENMENLMTVVDRLGELQASSVGRRECSSTRQRTGARRMDVHVDTYSQCDVYVGGKVRVSELMISLDLRLRKSK